MNYFPAKSQEAHLRVEFQPWHVVSSDLIVWYVAIDLMYFPPKQCEVSTIWKKKQMNLQDTIGTAF